MIDVTEAFGLTFAFPANDETIGRCLREHGEFARVEVELMAALMRRHESGTLIDVGANIGAVCLPLARDFPRWRIAAIEAQRRIAMLLAHNVVANRLANVEVQVLAAGEQTGVASFPILDLGVAVNFGGLGWGAAPELPRESVLTSTLDELAPPDTRVVKIDVEGFEPQVLAGAARLLAKQRPAVFMEANVATEAASRAAMRLLADAGARLFWVFAPFVTRRPLKGKAPGGPIRGDFNVLALFDGQAPPWNLPELATPDAERPRTLDALPYLADFMVP